MKDALLLADVVDESLSHLCRSSSCVASDMPAGCLVAGRPRRPSVTRVARLGSTEAPARRRSAE